MSAINCGAIILAANAPNVMWNVSAKRMFVRLLTGSTSEPTFATKAHSTTYGTAGSLSLFAMASMTGVSMTAVVLRENIAVTIAPSTNAFR
jgi:hypothetical protein